MTVEEQLADSKQREAELEDALREHHKWHFEIGTAFFKEPDGEMVEIDLTDAYCDSSLYERTEQALAAKEPSAPTLRLLSRSERSAAGRAAGCVGPGPDEHPTGCGCHLAAKEPIE